MMTRLVENCYFFGYVDKMDAYRLVDPCKNEVVVNKDVRINEKSDMNLIDDHWFEANKSMDPQGSEVQKFEKSSCDVVHVFQVAIELPHSSDGGGQRL